MHDFESTDLAGAAYLAGDDAPAWPEGDDDREPMTDCPFCEVALLDNGECPNCGPLYPSMREA